LARENSFVKSRSHWSRDTARLSELSSGAFECPERSNFRMTTGSKRAFASQRERIVSLSQDKRVRQNSATRGERDEARAPLNRSSLSWNVTLGMTPWMKRGGRISREMSRGIQEKNSSQRLENIFRDSPENGTFSPKTLGRTLGVQNYRV